MKRQLVLTQDGSHSLYLPEMDEHYHSIHGSLAESEHIFIQSGLLELAKQTTSIRVLEVGMGTGLNLLKSLIASEDLGLNIEYTALEAFPIPWKEMEAINFPDLLKNKNAAIYFRAIHDMDWETQSAIRDNFLLRKRKLDWLKFESDRSFNLIYFDAFAPEKQSEMWSPSSFENLVNYLEPNAILVTYCVKGEVRRMLSSLGFEIEKIPGPLGGKREILRARYSGHAND